MLWIITRAAFIFYTIPSSLLLKPWKCLLKETWLPQQITTTLSWGIMRLMDQPEKCTSSSSDAYICRPSITVVHIGFQGINFSGMRLLTFSTNFSSCSQVVRLVTIVSHWLSFIRLGFYTWGSWGIAATADEIINALFQLFPKFGLNLWVTNDFFLGEFNWITYLEKLNYTEIHLRILNYMTIVLKTYFLFHDHNGISSLWVWFWKSNTFANKISTLYSLKNKVVKLWVKDFLTVFLK